MNGFAIIRALTRNAVIHSTQRKSDLFHIFYVSERVPNEEVTDRERNMQNAVNRQPRRLGKRQAGQGMTEYIIIVALIAIAAITVVSFFGGTVRNQIGGMAKELSGQSASDSIQAAKDTADTAADDAARQRNLGNYENTVSE